MKITEEKIVASYQGLLENGESVVSATYGTFSPKSNPYWMTVFLGAIGYLIAKVKNVFLVTTDRRVLVIVYGKRLDPIESFALNWSDINKIKIGNMGGIVNIMLGSNQLKHFFTIANSGVMVKTEKDNVKKLLEQLNQYK